MSEEMNTWTLPRDMSKFSTLEADLLFAVWSVGLPEPTPEYRFVPRCCAHARNKHGGDIDAPYYCSTCGGGAGRHRFDEGRKWRFDFAWTDRMLAVECEGGGFVGGRHNTGAGMEADMEKYSTAEAMGWHVLRFTQRQITSGLAIELIERALRPVEAHKEVE